jgi:type IV secretory pathway TraG/TraD family ATPase VirD4
MELQRQRDVEGCRARSRGCRVSAPLAVTLMEQLIRRQRIKVAQWEEYPRIGMFLDELPNTPLPKILQYFAEARGLGVSICAAAQASSQLDVVYGALPGRAIRDVVPATLIMYGAHEEELMRSAAFWAGKTTRSHQSYGHNLDDSTTSRQFGNALEPEELSPRNMGQARLLVRGIPGQMVELIEWTEFVKYLDELRGARRNVGSQFPCPNPSCHRLIRSARRSRRGHRRAHDVAVGGVVCWVSSASGR